MVYDVYEMYTVDGAQCAIIENINLFASENDADKFLNQRVADVTKIKSGTLGKPDRVIKTTKEIK